MKLRHLIIVSLILAIITIGAASASEDADAVSADSIAESSVDDVDVVSHDENDDEYVEEYFDEGDVEIDVYYTDISDDEDYSANIYDNNYINGTVTFSINSQQKFSKYISSSEKTYEFEFNNYLFDYQNYNPGNYSVTASYLKNGKSTPFTVTKTVEFKYGTHILFDKSAISVGETTYIIIDAAKGSAGTATLYNYTDGNIGALITSVSIVNGQARVPISGLTKGSHGLYLNYTINNEKGYRTLYLTVKENSPGYAASVSTPITTGSNAVVTFSGQKTDGWLDIYVDGKEYKNVKYAGGLLSESIAGLALGEHVVAVRYDRGNDFYSNTFLVNVKAKANTISLALKTVTVKKSAKKLVLQATLKINKKVAKSKTVKFKFNGKTYKAKTNKKGVAKVTIKKSVLKKLKVGKKVKYQASYGKKTVKKTAKVKK